MQTQARRVVGKPLALLFTIISLTNSAAVELTDSSQIDEIYSGWTANTPGGAIGILLDGELIYANAFGMADLESGIPITLDSKFNIASVSKMFTAFAILLLEEQGKLSLNDDIRRYLPTLPEFEETITIYHLLHHQSGIRNFNTLMAMQGRGEFDFKDRTELFELLTRQKELNHSPGDIETYSNTTFYLLALIVEEVSQQSFVEFTNEQIFAPLDMRDTAFAESHDQVMENRAWGYIQRSNGEFEKVIPQNNVYGPSNLIITLNDFVKWHRNLLSPTVGSYTLIEKLYAPGILNNGAASRFAKGLGYNTIQGINTRGMSGLTTGYRSDYVQHPDLGLTLITLTNSNFNLYSLHLDVLNTCCAVEKREAELALEQFNRKFVAITPDELRTFEGAYKIDGSDDVIFVTPRIEIGGIYITGLEFPLLLKPIANRTFESINPVSGDTVIFTTDSQNATKMTVKRHDIELFTTIQIQPVIVDEAYLNQFAGRYHSAELQSSFDIVVEGTDLYRAGEGFPTRQLAGGYIDVFTAANDTGTLVFERDDSGLVASFRMSVAGANNVLYEKDLP